MVEYQEYFIGSTVGVLLYTVWAIVAAAFLTNLGYALSWPWTQIGPAALAVGAIAFTFVLWWLSNFLPAS